ncbi:MAG TPA: PrsW family intramembrane metalloprotease [Pyrinomonadaceae bacterium]
MVYPNQNYPNQAIVSRAATITFQRKKQTNVFAIAFLIVGALVALLLGLLTLLVIGIDTGPIAFMIGLVAATIPVPMYVILVVWIDRYESEPFWMLATAFFWGALVATFFAFLLNTTGALIVNELAGKNAGELFALVISAPIVEESGKAAILFLFFFFKKDEFDGVIDGIVYASLVALGFAMTENIHYYGTAALKGSSQLTLVFFIRGALAPFSHPLFTSMTGIGLGLARQTNNLAVKLITPVVGFLMAMCMHSIWNGSGALFGGGGFLLTYVLIMVPAFLILLIVIAVSLRREGQVVREFLLCDLQNGMLDRKEYDQLGSIFGRMGSSFNALTSTGLRGWRARMQFNQMASELAFHRCRTARGLHSAKVDVREVEDAYLHILRDLLRNVRTR